ncbi:hypothetical protein D3877_29230 [Azospirillum cavernae]|uniref:Uncharacterized protein n=1 Tax=Azospirillum cavernae TaxID=2320860 RepID=A0A418VK04_9PROT|nr:division plane positioning ATPase MipZ [Azospirillum cavernae]RJF76470.1 hypothetical protein D3877_29230 [Azospirillum cavernae]
MNTVTRGEGEGSVGASSDRGPAGAGANNVARAGYKVVVGGVKGGPGASTISVHLAVAFARRGLRVLLVDGDEHSRSSARWAATRRRTAYETAAVRLGKAVDEIETDYDLDDGITTIRQSGTGLRTEIARMAPDYDLTVIDLGGHDDRGQRAAMTIADAVLIPIGPSAFDCWTLEDDAWIALEMRVVREDLPMLALLNKAEPEGGRRGAGNAKARAAIALLTGQGIRPAISTLGLRTAYARPLEQGLTAMEIPSRNRDRVACAEVAALADEVVALLNGEHDDYVAAWRSMRMQDVGTDLSGGTSGVGGSRNDAGGQGA